MPGTHGELVGKIFPAVFHMTDGLSGDGRALWRAPARCIIVDQDTTQTAAISGYSRVADTTGTFRIQLRNVTDGATDLLLAAARFSIAPPATDNVVVAGGVASATLVTTQASHILEYGETLAIDIDSNTISTGQLFLQVLLQGI